uniref:Uncharacterized protein n=1 Tax=Solanum lycopersicum TaxID=4081 RepID=A0A3Q7I4Y8_SOLLC
MMILLSVVGGSHLNGSTGSVSSRIIAASKQSAASAAEPKPPSLYNRPRLYHAEAFIRSRRSASVRRLRIIAGDCLPIFINTTALDTRLGTWDGLTAKALE